MSSLLQRVPRPRPLSPARAPAVSSVHPRPGPSFSTAHSGRPRLAPQCQVSQARGQPAGLFLSARSRPRFPRARGPPLLPPRLPAAVRAALPGLPRPHSGQLHLGAQRPVAPGLLRLQGAPRARLGGGERTPSATQASPAWSRGRATDSGVRGQAPRVAGRCGQGGSHVGLSSS